MSENESAKKPQAETPNLESIMHIPLDLSVELGRISMPLYDVTRLARGTVIEMQKDANAGVDILANGQVFARGEVVSADGKLGVRVVEIVSPGSRLQALG